MAEAGAGFAVAPPAMLKQPEKEGKR